MFGIFKDLLFSYSSVLAKPIKNLLFLSDKAK